MRLWHWMFLVLMAAVAFGIARDPIGRVALVVFVVGLIEIVLGTTAVMTLFRTLGAFGAARTLLAHFEAVLATLLVLVTASVTMNAVFAVGVRIMQAVVR